MDCQELIVRLNCVVLLESGDDIDTGWLGMGTKLSYVQGGQGYVRMGNFGFLGGMERDWDWDCLHLRDRQSHFIPLKTLSIDVLNCTYKSILAYAYLSVYLSPLFMHIHGVVMRVVRNSTTYYLLYKT